LSDKIWWSMKDLKEKTGRGEDWLKENILYRPGYKAILDLEQGGFVYYPEKKGEAWCFIADKMADFLTIHFAEIYQNKVQIR
jgi:phage pi2 protein 07